MKIAIAHFYCDGEYNAWADVIDTDLLPTPLANQFINAINNNEEGISLTYDEMQNELMAAQVKTFPCTIEGSITVYDC